MERQEMKEAFPSRIQAVYNKPIANIMLSGEKPQKSSHYAQDKAKVSTLSLSINIVLEIIVRATWQERGIKGIQTGKESKVSLFADDDSIYKRHQRLHKKHS